MSGCSKRWLNQSSILPHVQRRMPGFTMLEVCVVLFIVALLFVVTVPVASHLLDEEKPVSYTHLTLPTICSV